MSTTAHDLEAREARLREQLDGPEPITWRPDDQTLGHSNPLIGELVAVNSTVIDVPQRGPERKQIAVLKAADGQLWNVWLLHQVLIDEFVGQQPKIGDHLAVRWDGRKKKTATSNGYEMYRLAVDRATPRSEGEFVDHGHVEQVIQQVEPPDTPPPATRERETCAECGWRAGQHRTGCPNDADGGDDIPF